MAATNQFCVGWLLNRLLQQLGFFLLPIAVISYRLMKSAKKFSVCIAF